MWRGPGSLGTCSRAFPQDIPQGAGPKRAALGRPPLGKGRSTQQVEEVALGGDSWAEVGEGSGSKS